MNLPALAIITPKALGGCYTALAQLGSVPPPGNQCSFHLLIHTPRIDRSRPGHPACRQQLSAALLSSPDHRWPAMDPGERAWCSRSLVAGEGEITGGYWAARDDWQHLARQIKLECSVMICIWIDRRLSGWVSKICGWMDGSIEQCVGRWMELRCHSDKWRRGLKKSICPAEECNNNKVLGVIFTPASLQPLSIKENHYEDLFVWWIICVGIK